MNLGVPGSGTRKQVERLETFIEKYGWKPKEVKLFFFGMSGSWSAGNDFVDNYDRYMWEHAAQGDGEQGFGHIQSGSEATVELAERVISKQALILEHSTLMRRVEYYWGPMIKSVLVADPCSI